jgi:SNF2 family DNA or RNA helicase
MRPELYPHQTATVERALRRGGSLAILHEPGLGKTRTCLEIYTRLKASTPTLKMLVVCPLSLVEAVWKTETETYTPYRWTNVKKLSPEADIWVVNFESAIRPNIQRRLAPLWQQPLLLVVDESSRLKDARSLTTKTLLAIAEHCRYRLICSGTPAPNGLWELWAQLRVVDPNVFHKSFFAWRREYFHLARYGKTLAESPPGRYAMQQLFQHGWQWDISAANRDRLLARCAPICSWVRKADALHLPERIVTIRHVTLSPEETTAYEAMRKHLVVEFAQETVTAEIALTKLLRLRQLSSGFLYGETQRHQTGGSRLKVLLETLEELGEQPVIIWCHFHEEIEQLAAALGEKAVTLYAKTADRAESLRRFGRDAQYLIAHPRSAGHGLTLTQASTCVWYSLDWSLEAYTQANDRIHRIGQTRSCLYVHLIAKGRIDEDIWDVLQQKRTLQEAIDRVLASRSADSSRHRAGNQAAVAEGICVSSLR